MVFLACKLKVRHRHKLTDRLSFSVCPSLCWFARRRLKMTHERVSIIPSQSLTVHKVKNSLHFYSSVMSNTIYAT